MTKQTEKFNFFRFPKTTFQGELSDLLVPSSIEELMYTIIAKDQQPQIQPSEIAEKLHI